MNEYEWMCYMWKETEETEETEESLGDLEWFRYI